MVRMVFTSPISYQYMDKVNHMMPPVQDSAGPVPEFFLFPFKYFSVFLKIWQVLMYQHSIRWYGPVQYWSETVL